ncbi:LysR family transcriptional regulator [Philodulcilactobacillus myokoensis]|uniref:LysR family transcriptional regulator n=1 Tax=Philodulcilactobacillus myokoensis TaxID=2929573 RepID=A0A9W6B045_9LACO|nr:LysR substrate-binding domain-containing protein [Philodulcilactobacillus myokoensis]GLB46156.1 LysR family transcriptional regulator [Philodulcilactobacillus myokoensis]
MNIRDLEYFITLVELKNFSRTAKHFHVSQPTITLALKRLENEMGAQLIIRNRYQRLIVTDSGRQLLKHAKQIVKSSQISKKEIANLKRKKLRIGLPPIIEAEYFAPIAKRLKDNGLLQSIETFEFGSENLLKQLKQGKIDFAFLGTLNSLNDNDIDLHEFARKPFKIFVSKNNRLNNNHNLHFKALKDYDFVIFKNGFIQNEALKMLAQRNKFTPKIAFQSYTTNSLLNMIADDVGIGFFMSSLTVDPNRITKLALKDHDVPQFVMSMATRHLQVFNPIQRKIIDIIKETIGNINEN